jgi:environmental stress-induced protein Ves
MAIHRYTPEQRKSIQWASGTSTEIFVFPADGNFAERSFTFRISTATVEAESSTFTFFEGITRHLMILKGSLELIHEGRYTKKMQPYDQDVFSGEWNTRSNGKVTDFNLMLKNGATGGLVHAAVMEGKVWTRNKIHAFEFVFVAEGEVRFRDNRSAKAGDLLQLDDSAVSLEAVVAAELVFIHVDL